MVAKLAAVPGCESLNLEARLQMVMEKDIASPPGIGSEETSSSDGKDWRDLREIGKLVW